MININPSKKDTDGKTLNNSFFKCKEPEIVNKIQKTDENFGDQIKCN